MNIPTGYRVRGQKPLTLFSFVWRKRGAFLDKRIPIRQILSLLAAYIGRTHLPKSRWEVKHNGKNY